jgi:hypothetical protein
VWLALVLALPSGAQNGGHWNPQQSSPEFKGPPKSDATEFDRPEKIEEEKRLSLLNAARQKSLISDTNKLLKAATELNAEMAAANFSALTPAQLKRVGEIEKLARNVKDKMSSSVRGTPSFESPIDLSRP